MLLHPSGGRCGHLLALLLLLLVGMLMELALILLMLHQAVDLRLLLLCRWRWWGIQEYFRMRLTGLLATCICKCGRSRCCCRWCQG